MIIEELIKKISNSEACFPEITEEQAIKAYVGALTNIKDKYDALYFLTSMNLLNAYVKKGDADKEFAKNYRFKDYVTRGIEQILSNDVKEVYLYVDNSIAYISVMGLQFSFHNIKSTGNLLRYKNSKKNIKQDWAGIRLQPPAALIFEYVEAIKYNKKHTA